MAGKSAGQRRAEKVRSRKGKPRNLHTPRPPNRVTEWLKLPDSFLMTAGGSHTACARAGHNHVMIPDHARGGHKCANPACSANC